MPEFKRANPITDVAFRNQWKAEQEQRCQVCYITIDGMRQSPHHVFAEFHVHHLIGGANGRSDEACNLLLLGHRCHMGAAHSFAANRNLTREHLLWVKMQTDEWNPERLWELAHKRHEPVELPDVYQKERERNDHAEKYHG